jgi:hypothetical protein
MQRRILRNLSLRLDVYREPLTHLITAELRDTLHIGRATSVGECCSSINPHFANGNDSMEKCRNLYYDSEGCRDGQYVHVLRATFQYVRSPLEKLLCADSNSGRQGFPRCSTTVSPRCLRRRRSSTLCSRCFSRAGELVDHEGPQVFQTNVCKTRTND